MPPLQKLIITSDDCGLSEGINLAALDLYQQGLINNASIIANYPATAHALHLFSNYASLDLGVHLNLTDGRAITSQNLHARLTDHRGIFFSRARLFAMALRPDAAFLARVEAELSAQIRVIEEAGVRPSHLSTHMHFHMMPSLRRIVIKLARQRQIPWVRTYRARASLLPYAAYLQSRTTYSELRQGSTRYPDYLTGLYFWMGFPPKMLSTTLNKLAGSVELVVHPGIENDKTFPNQAGYSTLKRAAETRYLKRLHPLLVHA